jgi:hypothetical protein
VALAGLDLERWQQLDVVEDERLGVERQRVGEGVSGRFRVLR